MFLNLFLAASRPGTIILIVIISLVVIFALSCVKIVRQAEAFVVERLGQYYCTWESGVHFLVPFFFRVTRRISKKEQVVDYEPQPVITKDNVTMQIDTVVFYQVTDCKFYAYGVEDPRAALEKLTATTLRNIIGEIELDATLTSRDLINTKMRDILDIATDAWGIRVNRVELKNILPPKDIRDAMEKQMRAERERRESILRAEGEKRSAILQAEGFKESEILRAEAQRQVLIEEAEGNKRAAILQAEGEAEAILQVQEATAKGLELIKKAGVDQAVLALKAYEALVEMSKGQATKIIIPSEIQSLAGLATSMSEVLKNTK